MQKKIILLALVLCFFIQYIPFADSFYKVKAADNSTYASGFRTPVKYTFKPGTLQGDTMSQDAWNEALKTLPKKPDGTNFAPYISRNSSDGTHYYGFNFTLFFAKGIVVYGDAFVAGLNWRKPDAVQKGYVDFKDKAKYPDDGKNSGYYSYTCYQSNNGYAAGQTFAGEYRYHGFDYKGDPYCNTFFPIDGEERSINTYTWLKQPWGYPSYKGVASVWNNEALRCIGNPSPGIVATRTAHWISRLFKDEGEQNHQKLTFNRNNMTGEKYEYANVMTAPSSRYIGEAILWTNLGTLESPSYRYRTSYIEAVKKLMPDVKVSASLKGRSSLSVDTKGDAAYMAQEVAFDVTVDALVDDNNALSPHGRIYNDPVKEVVYYNRKDIDNTKGWNIRVHNGTRSNIPANDNKMSTTTFSVKVTNAVLADAINNKGGKLTIPVTAEVNFFKWYADNSLETPKGSASMTLQIPVTDAPVKDLGTVTVRHIDDSTSEVLRAAEYKVPIGILQEFQAESITGYKLKAGEPVKKTITLTNAIRAGTITFRYIKGTPTVSDPTPPQKPKQFINPNIYLPQPAFDIVPYKPKDLTSFTDVLGDPATITNKQVYVDGTPVDYNHFFSGNYTFGATGYDRLANIVVTYTADDDSVSAISRWIPVYNTKPRVQLSLSGSYKQNRKMTANNTSIPANTSILMEHYPINSYTWSIQAIGTEPEDGTDVDIRTGTATDLLREFTFKKTGRYRITLTGTNTLGLTSEPYILDFTIQKDMEPAVICELDNVSVARGEEISAFFYESVSTDGDTMENTNVSLYYDSDSNGTPETLVQTWTGVKNGEFPQYTPAKLGMYRWSIESKEKMGGDIIAAHVTASDAAGTIKTRDFWVDNFVPQTSVYSDVEPVRPLVDLYILTDANLEQEKTDYIKTNRMSLNNYLRGYNVLPVVEQWDMKTYEHSHSAETTHNTGGAYPSGTLYYTSEGYSGTLNRTNVTDARYTRDEGSWSSRTESKTATASGPQVTNVTSGYYCSVCGNGITSDSRGSFSSSYSYSDGEGYSGTLSYSSSQISFNTSYGTASTHTVTDPVTKKSSTVYHTPYTNTGVYQISYSGTVSRTVTYWVSNLVWYSNYTGYYSGMIYKNVRQPYTDPFRSTADKYVLYIGNGSITDLADLRYVLSKSGGKLIAIGADTVLNQVTPEKLIISNKPIEDTVKEALDYIGSKTATVEEKTVLAGVDTFSIQTDDFDQEGDPLVSCKFQYVHDLNYLDNCTAREAYANAVFDINNGWVDTKASMFTKPGKYSIYRRVKDLPSTDPLFAQYSYYSGISSLNIIAHRKPIAGATLDWDYDGNKNAYITRWVDMSYDLDHQFNRADKGIVERKIMFRKAGDNWSYTIPAELSAGTYELNYYVKDPEGAWSDSFIMNFTLNDAPPIQFEAAARTLDNSFSLSSAPASEYLEAYNLWTRYPYNLHLELAMYRGSTRVTGIKTVNYSTSTGTKTGNDITWNNITCQIPETLTDGSYTFRISAVDDNGNAVNKEFPVTVRTPVNLVPNMTAIYAGMQNTIKANTTKYPNTTTVNLYKGTTYSTTLNMTGAPAASGKEWTVNYTLPNGIPDGTYTAEFTSRTPNGNTEIKSVSFQVLNVPLIIKSDLKMAYHRYSGKTAIPIVKELAVPDKPDYYSVEEPAKLQGFITAGRVLAVRVVARGNITGVKFDFSHSSVTHKGTTWDYNRSIKRLDRDTRWFEWYSELTRKPQEPSPFCRLDKNTAFSKMFAQYGLNTTISNDPSASLVNTLDDLEENNNRYYNAAAWPLDAAKCTYEFTKQEMAQRENNGTVYANSFGNSYTNLDIRTAKDDPTGETKLVTFYYPIPYLTNQTLKTWHWMYRNENSNWAEVVAKDNDDEVLTRITSPYKISVRLYNGSAYSEAYAYFDVLEPWMNIDKGYGERIGGMLEESSPEQVDIEMWETHMSP